MFHLRLRQAETALVEGRLNEAARLVELPEVRDHRDGQKLLTRVVDALVERGREHLEANRLAEAGKDCSAARHLSGDLKSVAELSANIAKVTKEHQQKARRKQEVAAEAGREVARGELELGEKILNQLTTDDSTARTVARQVSDQIAVSRERIDAALARAQRAVDSGRTRESVPAIADLQQLAPGHPELAELIDRVTAPVLDEIRQAVSSARLDRVDSLISSVQSLVNFDPELSEFRNALELAREAGSLLESHQFDAAQLQLRKLGSLLGSVDWLDDLIDQTQQATALATDLKSGPLALMSDQNFKSAAAGLPSSVHPKANSLLGKPAVAHRDVYGSLQNPSSPPLVLHVDGVGGSLLTQSSHLNIGAPGRSRSIDLPLTGCPAGATCVLDRKTDSWSLQAESKAELRVNEKPTRTRRLADGDSVSIGKRCHFRFRQSSSAVPTAVLDLTGTRLPRPDIRTVVLLDDTLIIGPGRASHLIAGNLDQPLILFVRDGVYYVRSGLPNRAQRFGSNGLAAEANALQLDKPVEIGGTRVTISQFTQDR